MPGTWGSQDWVWLLPYWVSYPKSIFPTILFYLWVFRSKSSKFPENTTHFVTAKSFFFLACCLCRTTFYMYSYRVFRQLLPLFLCIMFLEPDNPIILNIRPDTEFSSRISGNICSMIFKKRPETSSYLKTQTYNCFVKY